MSLIVVNKGEGKVCSTLNLTPSWNIAMTFKPTVGKSPSKNQVFKASVEEFQKIISGYETADSAFDAFSQIVEGNCPYDLMISRNEKLNVFRKKFHH